MEEKPLENKELLQVEKTYRRDLAIVEAKPVIQRIGLFLWFGIDVLLILFFIGYILYYVFFGAISDRNKIATVENNIASIHAVSIANAAVPLAVDTSRILPSTENTYDLYSQITNTNANWYATFTYSFTSSVGNTDSLDGFIMPGEEKTLVAFAQSFDRRPSGADLLIEDLVWHRVEARNISDTKTWMDEHTKFDVENATHNTDVKIGNVSIAQTSFQITNNTAYSYWSPTFYVLLGRPGAFTAINIVHVPGFESGETRDVQVNWFGVVPSSAAVMVVPAINYFDDSVYMVKDNETQVDVRDIY